MKFSEIIGQDNVVNSLKNILSTENINHAYIFSGPVGIGKTTVAKVFSTTLLCENSKEDSCNDCIACKTMSLGTNPDFHIIEPDGLFIGIEKIRTLQENILVKPMYSSRKIYLIRNADKMTVAAQNCLLKTLEEPPKHIVIILTCNNLEGLLETVKSRSTRYNFKKNSPIEVKSYLQKILGNTQENLDFIIAYSDGIIGRALLLASSAEFSCIRDTVFQIIFNITESKFKEILFEKNFFEKNKTEFETILDIMLSVYRDLIVAKKLSNYSILINVDKKDIIFRCMEMFTTTKLIECVQTIEKTRKNIKQNANYMLAIETMLIKLKGEGCNLDGKSYRCKI